MPHVENARIMVKADGEDLTPYVKRVEIVQTEDVHREFRIAFAQHHTFAADAEWDIYASYDGQVDGIFAGDESGPKARPPAPLDWYRSVRDQCRRDDVAFFLKQFVRDRVKLELPKLDGRRHADFPTPYL